MNHESGFREQGKKGKDECLTIRPRYDNFNSYFGRMLMMMKTLKTMLENIFARFKNIGLER
jgi:hypothetical protein